MGFIIKNANLQLIEALEPWCSTVYCDINVSNYIKQEDTSFHLHDKIMLLENEKQNGILVKIDGRTFTQQDFNYIQQFAEIIQDSGEIGEFELGNLKINIIDLTTFEKDLIFIINSHNEKN